MLRNIITKLTISLALGGFVVGHLAGCGGESRAESKGGLEARKVADMLHAVMAADRKVYVKNVVNRLTKDQELKVIDKETGDTKPFKGSEDWENTYGTLPLPAQQFRYGSEEAYTLNKEFSYGLISSWAINKKHLPESEFEKATITQMETTGEPQYGQESVGGKPYFVAMYPDRATAKACWDCHNKHVDSPRTDFKQGEVMGGIIIRIPLD